MVIEPKQVTEHGSRSREKAAGVAAPSTVPVKAMSTTTTTHETVSTPVSTTDHDVALATIVAQSVVYDDLPDWDVWNAACAFVQDSVKQLLEEADY